MKQNKRKLVQKTNQSNGSRVFMRLRRPEVRTSVLGSKYQCVAPCCSIGFQLFYNNTVGYCSVTDLHRLNLIFELTVCESRTYDLEYQINCSIDAFKTIRILIEQFRQLQTIMIQTNKILSDNFKTILNGRRGIRSKWFDEFLLN